MPTRPRRLALTLLLGVAGVVGTGYAAHHCEVVTWDAVPCTVERVVASRDQANWGRDCGRVDVVYGYGVRGEHRTTATSITACHYEARGYTKTGQEIHTVGDTEIPAVGTAAICRVDPADPGRAPRSDRP